MGARKQAVLTLKAPRPLPGVYSQAVVANGVVYCSGQVPIDPRTNELIEGDIKKRTQQCLELLSAVLDAAGTTLNKCVEVTVFLTNMEDFAAVDEVYKQYFTETPPARTCVAVQNLRLNADIEIKCIALVSS